MRKSIYFAILILMQPIKTSYLYRKASCSVLRLAFLSCGFFFAVPPNHQVFHPQK